MQFIMGYEPFYHARAWRRVEPEVCLYIVKFYHDCNRLALRCKRLSVLHLYQCPITARLRQRTVDLLKDRKWPQVRLHV